MTNLASTELDLWRVDPTRLTRLMTEAGWTLVGRRSGIYNRLAPPGETDPRSGSFVVPLDREAPEFIEVLQHLLEQVTAPSYRGLWARAIAPRLFTDPTDEFRFRREATLPSGLISWREGERLISCARRTLVAGAKSYMDQTRHFGNRHGQFANRYLDSVLMGQTEPGSYIVKAFAPSVTTVPLRKPSASAPPLDLGVAAAGPYGRDVSHAVVKALSATVEAIDHYRSSGSLTGFEAGVRQGISYEMATAILGIAEHSDGSDITIEWDTSVPGGFDEPVSRYEFSGGDAIILEKAAHQLAAAEDSGFVTVTGRVHLLTRKEADGPGVFGVENLMGGQPRKVRVRLADEDQYREVIHAYEENLALQVHGRLEREGNLHWLYDASVMRTVGQLNALTRSEKSEIAHVPQGQMTIDDAG